MGQGAKFAAGGPTDVVARILSNLLAVRWRGQSVTVENRPGAGTIVATAAVAKSPTATRCSSPTLPSLSTRQL